MITRYIFPGADYDENADGGWVRYEDFISFVKRIVDDISCREVSTRDIETWFDE